MMFYFLYIFFNLWNILSSKKSSAFNRMYHKLKVKEYHDKLTNKSTTNVENLKIFHQYINTNK